MPLALRLSLAFAIACAMAYLATPGAIALAERLQFRDEPTGYKGHLRPTPYLGGVAVMAGFVVAVLVAAGHWHKTLPLLGGALMLLVVGTVDDRRGVSAGARVVVELALGVLAWSAGLGWHLHAGGALDLSLTCLWVLGVVNAFNLFDNMDGAASTMALVVSAGAAVIGGVRGDVWLAAGGASLGGACVGFLPRNLSGPARIFLGDGGSMPIGYAVAVLVMAAAGTSHVAWRSLLVALLLVGIPALDTSLVVYSRRRRGVSILSGGRDHLTHRARRFLGSARAVSLLLGLIQAALCGVAILASQGGAALLVISASAYLLTAGAAVVVLDAVPIDELAAVPAPARLAALSGRRAVGCLAVLGLGAGLSPFFFAYYDASVWVPIGLGLTLLCAAAMVMRPLSLRPPAALCAGGLLGLAVWSLASAAWAESIENAVIAGNRWLTYGALLLLLLALIGNERRALVVLGAAALGIVVVATSVVVRLAGTDPGSLFLNARLNSPLGYVNGEGCLFAMGIWPLLALAESRRALLAGAACGSATALACLALLTQSRGTALALIASILLVCAIAPRRTTRVYALLLIAGATALAGPALLRVGDDAVGGRVTLALAHSAARGLLESSIGAGIVWAAIVAAVQRTASAGRDREAGRIARGLLVVALVAAVALGAGNASRLEGDLRKQWQAFVSLAEPSGGSAQPGASRLLSAGGHRYDYWRIAVDVFAQHPLLGVGAANYARFYYERRHTAEDVDQPHSLELQVLSELGLVGALLLLCFLVGAFWGALRMRSRALRDPLCQALLVAALGVFTTWLAQTSVDWIHLLPGVTAIALGAVAVMLWPDARGAAAPAGVRSTAPRERGGPQTAALCAIAAILIAAGASLSRQEISQALAARARGELSSNPAGALRDAEHSLGVDPDSTQTLYVKAAALARFDRGPAAEGALLKALEQEPRNFVTWALLGDIAVRERMFAVARRDYRRAHILNPRDRVLAEAAANPALQTR